MDDEATETGKTSRSADLPRETTLGSRRGFAGKRVRVRVDEVRLPSGRTTVRVVVEVADAVAVVPVTTDGRVLLIRQYHHAIGRELLGLPAGTREPGEAATTTAARELVEETGHAAERLTELAAFFTSPGYTEEGMILFRASGCRPTGGGPDPDELIALAPVPLADIPALLAPGSDRIRDAKTLVGLLWLLREPGAGGG